MLFASYLLGLKAGSYTVKVVPVDAAGKEYYMVKNSWGETGDYKGTWYMTKNFIIANTMDYMVNKNAIPKDILKKIEDAKKKQSIAD